MKAGQFTDEQIVAILQEAARGEKPIATLCRDKGISEATFYTWRKKLLANRDLEIDCLKEINSKNW